MQFLSVIIPAHNEEKTICKTVDSLLYQYFDPYEIIIVNDGSTDFTGKILLDYYGFDQMSGDCQNTLLETKRILHIWNAECNNVPLFLIEKENGGKADSLNAGINFCHGEYFACIDADCILPFYTLNCLTKEFDKDCDIVAVGGAVIPVRGINTFLKQKGISIGSLLEGCQELEYGKAFNIVRPIFDATGTTMLISGALGVFNRDLVIKFGGYALDTVGEDMELVMRIRQYCSSNHSSMKIAYTKDAVCFTELPWKISDLFKQRIRWTVGLSEVLWRYRRTATDKGPCLKEKIAFLYYVVFEKYAPLIRLLSLLFYVCFKRTVTGIIPMVVIALFQMVISLIGSFGSIKQAIRTSYRKLNLIIKTGFLLIVFTTVYNYVISFIRLIAVPYYRIKKINKKGKNAVWNSPTRK